MSRPRFWRYARGLAVPLLLWGLVLGLVGEVYWSRLRGEEPSDEAALREWIEEARIFRENLPGLARDYLHSRAPEEEENNADRIREQLRALGDVTKAYQGQLPLFPAIYRLEVSFAPAPPGPLVWDSLLPRQPERIRSKEFFLCEAGGHKASLRIDYLLHAFNKRQRDEFAAQSRLRWLSLLAVAGTGLAGLWIYLIQKRERERAEQRALAQSQIDAARRQHQEVEHKLLEQRLATQAAERSALELKSQLYASIGIMAGSYAHNIKNLLVRPNDLISRCLESVGLSGDQSHMLLEVRETLHTVTERLQQILQTVRRDPTRSERARLDLGALAMECVRTWEEMARDKWKLELTVEAPGQPVWIEGDHSHLQQMLENLLFNARDATFEMRGWLRDRARQVEGQAGAARKQALIAAAAWKGAVRLVVRSEGGQAVLEVRDNGIGMSEEVQKHCTETHFSTKRQNALFEGNTTGMGLGLSFVAAILEHHRAKLEIESSPQAGAVFRVRFPLG